MFKKRTKDKSSSDLRRKTSGPDEDPAVDAADDEIEIAPEVSRPTISKKKDKKKDKDASKKSGLLSFEDDEEEAAFVVKKAPDAITKQSKSGGAHRISSKKEREKDSDSNKDAEQSSNLVSGAGLYSKESLQELAREQKFMSGSRAESKPTKSTADPVIKLQGSFKALTQDTSADMMMDGLARFKPPPEFVVPAPAAATTTRLAGAHPVDGDVRVVPPSVGPGSEFVAPDAATIKAAKARRERLRNAAATPDYMPLRSGEEKESRERQMAEAGGEAGAAAGSASSGESEEDEDVRLKFIGGAGKKGRDKRGVLQDQHATEDGEEGDDDEEERWAMEQLKKGVAGGAKSGMADVKEGAKGAALAAMEAHARNVAASMLAQANSSRSVSTLETNAQEALASLTKGLAQLQQAHDAASKQLSRVDVSLKDSMSNLTMYQQAQSGAAAHYHAMQELKEYVADLCDCLQDKAPLIEELEEHMQRSTEQRATAYTDRRQAEREDEANQMDAAISAALGVSDRGADAMAMAAAAAKNAVLNQFQVSSMADVDEFGRDTNMGRRMEIQNRRARMARRRARAEQRRRQRGDVAPADMRELGETSSEESEGEQTTYTRQLEEVTETSGGVFGDASNEFAELEYVKNKFEQWKRLYPQSYRDAYVGMSAPAIFAPFVRLELLSWSPLYTSKGLDSMSWYNQLFNFGMPDNMDDLDPEDPDGNLVPSLVHKVALPIVHHAAECWDPYSSKQTKCLANAVKEILIYCPPEDDESIQMMNAVHRKLAEAVKECVLPSWPIAAVGAAQGAAELSARRFGEAVRLIRNVAAWEEVLPQREVQALALNQLIAYRMVPHLHSLMPLDALFRLGRALSAIPDNWITDSHDGIAALRESAAVVAQKLLKRGAVGGSGESIGKRVIKILTTLGDTATARSVAKTFGIRNAL